MQPQRVAGAVVTPNFFETLKVSAEVGRAFSPFDKTGIPLAVLSYSLWQKQYGGDPSVIGKPIEIDGEPRTVVGIMPARFQFPIDCEAWTLSRFAVPEQPLAPTVDQSNARDAHYFDTLGRLSRGVTIAQVQAETEVIARRLKRQYANDEEAIGSTVISLHDDLVGQTKSALLVLLGGVTLLLLISCVNVANILLARGSSRQKEIAIRSALGAGRLRIVRQLLTESLLLAVGGGIAGALLAWLVWIPLRTSIPPEMLSGFVPTIDWRVLTFTGALSLASGLIFGMFPALQTATSDLNNVLKEGGRGSMIGARAQRTQSFLVIVEMAFATVLLISAGLLIRSFVHLINVKTGVNPENVLTVELSLSSAHFPTTQSRSRFVSISLDRIRAIPGVVAAGITSRLPLNRGNSTRDMDIKGRSTAPSEDMNVDYLVVSPDYFRTRAEDEA